ncbi:hypothetical protein GDO81_011936 [Engystomops pustulosus]|uniref:Secreted protein n=1 Tax=Engystomops pustulosus TaxID=76066 RepID=A0AAV7BHR0_ENGPU|nr:hypothetical protein GDO81_011936 [Engystomops pustulosus]
MVFSFCMLYPCNHAICIFLNIFFFTFNIVVLRVNKNKFMLSYFICSAVLLTFNRTFFNEEIYGMPLHACQPPAAVRGLHCT